MKSVGKYSLYGLKKGVLGVATASLIISTTAYAGGTAAGTNIQNTFTLDYQVSGVSQPQINTGASGTNNPTEFTVDRLIDLTVTSSGNRTVAPGSVDQELVFLVTNNGNDKQAYSFSVVNETSDEYQAGALAMLYYVDDGDGVFEKDAGDGAGVAYTTGASPDLNADSKIWVVVQGDTPTGQTDTQTANVSLIADTLEPTTGASPGTAVVADTGGNSLTGNAENVLADGTGTSNEAANAGDHSATASYIVASPDLTGTKTVSIFSEDGAGCATIPGTAASGDQYSVPGACIEYVITVVNGGATATATNIAVSDPLPTELTWISAAANGFTNATIVEPSSTPYNCADSGGCVIGITGASLPAGSTGTLTIRALVK